ncbi:MAG: SDR family oxidoreductase, partial [Candidatus Schekmanbacteria bacterium]|nr:SDR family oxidoreductase [Candidatus Schekmanbacteria bacterium]
VSSGRIELVILRTGRSPPVASHPASRRRSHIWLRAGERMPEEDFHLSNHVRSQAREEQADGLGIPQAQRQRMIASLPFGRPATTEDVVAVVLFFSCTLSDFVTGQAINVSGGHQIA